MRGANLVVANSEFMAGCVGRRFGIDRERIVVVPQLCDVVPAPEHSSRNGDAIGFVNRNSDKNLGFVLELAAKLPGRRFVVYGSMPNVTAVTPNNVEFRGWESDRNRMFSQAGLWIMPSSWPEPF
jgi:glycosyltransferase involved in cell wall biosynthesis